MTKDTSLEHEKVVLGCLGAIVVFLVYVPLRSVIDVIVLRKLIWWFVNPLSAEIGNFILELPWLHLIALLMLKNFLFSPRASGEKQKVTWDSCVSACLINLILYPAGTIAIATILRAFLF